MWPLLADLDEASHVLELIRVLHGLAEVGIDLDIFAFLALDLGKLNVDLLLICVLLEPREDVNEHGLKILNSLTVKDGGLHKVLV